MNADMLKPEFQNMSNKRLEVKANTKKILKFPTLVQSIIIKINS